MVGGGWWTMEWPGWTPNGALLREFQSFFLDGEDGRSSVGWLAPERRNGL